MTVLSHGGFAGLTGWFPQQRIQEAKDRTSGVEPLHLQEVRFGFQNSRHRLFPPRGTPESNEFSLWGGTDREETGHPFGNTLDAGSQPTGWAGKRRVSQSAAHLPQGAPLDACTRHPKKRFDFTDCIFILMFCKKT